VVSVQNTGNSQQTFNLEVEGFQTYFVSEQQVWVHNCTLEVHHVVPESAAGARDARVNMRSHGLNPRTEPTNKVAIPSDKHNVTKRDSYVSSANDRVKNLGSADEIKAECCKIAEELKSSTYDELDKQYPKKVK
jgi:hypothetical protein